MLQAPASTRCAYQRTHHMGMQRVMTDCHGTLASLQSTRCIVAAAHLTEMHA